MSAVKILERRLALQRPFQVFVEVDFHLFFLLSFSQLSVVRLSPVFYRLGEAFGLDAWPAVPLEIAIRQTCWTSDLLAIGADSHRHVSGELPGLQH